ncbi:MAG: hypothetical protein BA868_00965 [Desulfobacterales bacterium C00003106]|nr:MAG: hypothetical protein BA868_00965 [Desulfobacterales bacterium C00003106]
MKKMKRLIVCVCLAGLICFGLVGCKEEASTESAETDVMAVPAEEMAPAEEAAPAEEMVVEEVAPAEEIVEEAAPADE